MNQLYYSQAIVLIHRNSKKCDVLVAIPLSSPITRFQPYNPSVPLASCFTLNCPSLFFFSFKLDNSNSTSDQPLNCSESSNASSMANREGEGEPWRAQGSEPDNSPPGQASSVLQESLGPHQDTSENFQYLHAAPDIYVSNFGRQVRHRSKYCHTLDLPRIHWRRLIIFSTSQWGLALVSSSSSCSGSTGSEQSRFSDVSVILPIVIQLSLNHVSFTSCLHSLKSRSSGLLRVGNPFLCQMNTLGWVVLQSQIGLWSLVGFLGRTGGLLP